MSRWQDRGEVSDSDSEGGELGFDTKSQSPERPAKRLRLGGSLRDCIQDDLQPQPDEAAENARSNQEDALAEEDVGAGSTTGASSGNGAGYLSHVAISSPSRHVQEYASFQHEDKINRGRSSATLDDQKDGLNLASSPPPRGFSRSGREDELSSALSSPLSSAPSSPLSEREFSPPAPPQLLSNLHSGGNTHPHGSHSSTGQVSGQSKPNDRSSRPIFRFPRLGATTDAEQDETRSTDDSSSSEQVPPPKAFYESATGRNFRARQQKQLHPYLYDRALYQRQCRERGLRPVRIVEKDKGEPETQDLFGGADDGASQVTPSSPVSPPLQPDQADTRPRESSPELGNRHFSIMDLDIPSNDDDSSSPPTSTKGREDRGSLKRRKLTRVFNPAREGHPRHSLSLDETQSVPTPPPTSSDSADIRDFEPPVPKFRLPLGVKPSALSRPQAPTPSRPLSLRRQSISSDEEPAARRLPRIDLKKEKALAPEPESSSSSSEPESPINTNMDEKRLQRERRRIRGVLPASWLRIDLQAQQKGNASSRRPRPGADPSPAASPQKGVARVVARPSSSVRFSTSTDLILDDDSDVDEPDERSAAPFTRRDSSRLPGWNLRDASNTYPDDDVMEVDWIDPMVAGSRKARERSTSKRLRQPRIKDALHGSAQRASRPFAEEKAFSRPRKRDSGQPRGEKSRSATTRTQTRAPAVRLSIVDGPAQSASASTAAPQFVRLAVRHARKQQSYGRHSPTQKHIRLATLEDTEDAIRVLRDWREGTIAPVEPQVANSASNIIDLVNVNEIGSEAGIMPIGNDDSDHGAGRSEQLASANDRRDQGASGRNQQIRPKIRRPRKPTIANRSNGVSVRNTNPGHSSQKETRTGSGNQPQSRRLHGRSQQPDTRFRSGQLETLESDFAHEHRTAAFARRIFCLTENVARRSFTPGIRDLPLDRYLQVNNEPSDQLNQTHSNEGPFQQVEGTYHEPQIMQQIPIRQRKRLARRIDADARQYRQPSEPLPEAALAVEQAESQLSIATSTLHGLGPFGCRYSATFDISPLQLGTYFHDSSFIGSGDFAASLELNRRNLSISPGRIRIHVGVNVFEWGPWTEDVATQLSRIPQALRDVIETLRDLPTDAAKDEQQPLVDANIDYLLRSTVRYFSKCLSFIDSIDRLNCVLAVRRLVDALLELLSDEDVCAPLGHPLRARCLTYALVLANQGYLLCQDGLVSESVQQDCKCLIMNCARRLAGNKTIMSSQELEAFYEANRFASTREKGIRDTDVAASSIVILVHLLHELDPSNKFVWDVLLSSQDPGIATLDPVSSFDKIWYSIFIVLPLFEIDSKGIARVGTRLQGGSECCSPIKGLLTRLFELYPATSSQPGSTVNEYVRATLVRCYHLITTWGWWRCEIILSAVFDFFAQRNLMQLDKEQGHGSSQFLENLAERPWLDVQTSDASFQIFLKMLASSLQGMSKYRVYSDKKIGSIAWRFIPNHGRTYRKDAEVRQEDIEALRNHHDLLCTLYYASPPGNRIQIALLQNLVNHSMSHREACRLNVKAWSNLASFQISTGEPLEQLAPICAWFQDFLATTINQYRLARSEVEQEIASARAQGTIVVSHGMIETTIIRNQRQIVATLIDALASLKRSILSAKNLGAVVQMIQGSTFWTVLDLFDPSTQRLNTMLDEALDVVKTAIDAQAKFCPRDESQPTSEDSQDFGDSSALQEFAATQMPVAKRQSVAGVLHDPFGQFISNLFGAETPADGTLLSRAIDIWVRLAAEEVRDGNRTWPSYIRAYSSNAWSELMDTEQKRKYTPYFLRCVVQQGDIDLVENDVLGYWIKSLVEREAMLKDQHALTEALLNSSSESPLLENLPFSCGAQSRQYSISLEQLRQRRLGLISTVLSNMRQHVDKLLRNHSSDLKAVRRAYGEILQQLMRSMRDNYLEVQAVSTGDANDNPSQGAYVDFVQPIVSFLQQYTTSIQAIDEFFTDSSAFPLPATDPTYVVGKLKSYVPKLAENGARKQLLAFFHSLCERAAVDNQQDYLVDQLTRSMTGSFEYGDIRAPSLSYVVCTAVFPPYIENALKTSASWIMALPILEAWGNISEGLLYDVVLEDASSVKAAVSSIDVLLSSVEHPIRASLTHPGLMVLPHIQRTLSAIFETVRKCLTVSEYLSHFSGAIDLSAKLARLASFAGNVQGCVTGPSSFDYWDSELEEWFNEPVCPWPETRESMRNEVRRAINQEWQAQDGQYLLRKKNYSKEVVVNLGDGKEEKERLLRALMLFEKSCRTVFRGQRVDDCSLTGTEHGGDAQRPVCELFV